VDEKAIGPNPTKRLYSHKKEKHVDKFDIETKSYTNTTSTESLAKNITKGERITERQPQQRHMAVIKQGRIDDTPALLNQSPDTRPVTEKK